MNLLLFYKFYINELMNSKNNLKLFGIINVQNGHLLKKYINIGLITEINIMKNSNNIIRINPHQNRKIAIPASEIIKKFRTLKDRQSFCKENSN